MKTALTGVVIVSLTMIALPWGPVLAGGLNRFRPSTLTAGGENDDNLYTPLDFEAAAASHPDADARVLVSRCRFAPFANDVSLYSAFRVNVSDAIVEDTPFQFADGTQCFNPQNESNIVVNPTNPNNVLTSANEYRLDGDEVYVSMDGGHTWNNVVLPGWTSSTGGSGVFARMSSCGDPVLAFAPDGTAYFSGLVCNTNRASLSDLGFSGVAVASSHDGGGTWSAPRMVSFSDSVVIFNDKDWITVGPDGTVYVTWTRFKVTKSGFGESPIVVSTSTDGGNSWSDWVTVSDSSHPFDQGAVPLVAPDGTLYVAYEGATPGNGYAGAAIIVARSTDGGHSFTNSEVARVFDDFNCYPHNIAQFRPTLTGEQFRINSFPSFAVDPTTGQLVISWADDQANPSCGYEHSNRFLLGATSNQVKLITSFNGLNWSTPRVITSGASDKVFPAVGANAGRIVVSYYTRAFSPGTNDCRAEVLDTSTNNLIIVGGPVCLDYALRSSTDNFATETRLTHQSSNPYITFAGSFIGDYTGAAVTSSGAVFAAWADFRGNPGVTSANMDIDVAFDY